jgi:hypothetical protein
MLNRRPLFSHPRPFTAGFAAGVSGALIISVMTAIFRAFGIHLLSFEMILGSLLVGQVGSVAWFLGFAWHLLNGGLFGLVYVAGFKTIGRANILIGAFFGLIQWLVAGYGIGTVPVENIPSAYRLVPDTGFFHSSSSIGIVLAYLFLHLFFGAIIGLSVGLEGKTVSYDISRDHPIDKAA